MRICGVTAALVLAGCSAGSNYQDLPPHSATGGKATGSNAAGTAATGGGVTSGGASGSSTGGASGGSTSGMICPPPSSALTDCGDAGLELRVKLETYTGAGTVLYQEPVTFYDVLSQDAVATSNACGSLYVCEPAGWTFAVEVEPTGAVTEVLADMALERSVYYATCLIIPDQVYSAVGAQLANFLPTDPLVFVDIYSATTTCPLAGWTFQLTDPDGGAVSSLVAYGDGIDASSSAPTNSFGKAFFYNIDPNATVVRVTGTLDPNVEADAGLAPGTCAFDGGISGLTGTAHVLPGTMTFFPFVTR